MRLDVIVPTYNRHQMLKQTLNSLLRGQIPSKLDVKVTVVDNNSTDNTRQVVEEWSQKFGGRLNYVFESRQGRSSALNAGIRSTDGDLVGMIDDDEEIDERWFTRVQDAFSQPDVDFVGGPYVPKWGASPPAWLPMNYVGVIGWIDGGNRVVPFDENYPGILMGGNAVLTRSIFERVGLYKTSLSRTGKRLLAGEDEDMYQRLREARARGFYLPDLIIHHYVPPERLTKRYFRKWCFWRGVSRGVLDREKQSPEVHLAGVPRWLYGEAMRSAMRMSKRAIKRTVQPAEHFSDELAMWDLAGFFYGRHFYRPAQ
jgi:glucosyl-dolichyl phosphate glucuronosyltransferase